jgi:predicted O-methyltransferase YrrM
VTGIDVWEPALEIAAENNSSAGLSDRVNVRRQDVAELADEGSYDCVWFRTFFVSEPVLDAAVPRLVRSLRPGGWLVLGRMAPPPDPLAEAASALRTILGGGSDFDAKRLAAALENAGCAGVRALARSGPAVLEYVIGQRPSG